MKNISITHKLLLGNLAILVIVLINAAASVSALHDARGLMRTLIDDSQPLVSKLNEFNTHLGKSSTALSTFLFTRADQQRIDYQNSIYWTGESLLELKEMPVVAQDSALADRVAAIDASFARFTSFEDELFNTTNWEHGSVAHRIVNSDLLPVMQQLQEQVDGLVFDLNQRVETDSALLVEDAEASMLINATLALAAIVLFALIVFAIHRSVTRPLRRTVAALEDVAAGDGDLSRRLEVDSGDEIGQLADAFNRFSGKLAALVDEVAGCAAQLSAAAYQMDRVAAGTNDDIQNQYAQIDEVVASIDHMSAKVRDVVDSTVEARGLAEETSRTAEAGRQVVDQSQASNSRLFDDVGNAAGVIEELVASVESISGMVDVIRGIAEQTNLLALNAAIEAARAGEQGRGFAVVADEVRTLASRTQVSTGEIQAMIEKLQADSTNAVEAMVSGREQAQQSLDHATEAGDSLAKINTTVQSMLERNRQIAAATEAQGVTADQVNGNMAAIRDLSRQTSDSAGLIASTSRHVSQLSSQLQELLGHFERRASEADAAKPDADAVESDADAVGPDADAEESPEPDS